jgi:hypothetical protein
MSTAGIVGFLEPRSRTSEEASSPRFDLIEALRRVRRAEIARITGIAQQLLHQFGPVIATGFLHAEVLGRLPQDPDWARHVEELQRNTLTVPAIVEELLAMAASKDACSPAEACSADRDRPAG